MRRAFFNTGSFLVIISFLTTSSTAFALKPQETSESPTGLEELKQEFLRVATDAGFVPSGQPVPIVSASPAGVPAAAAPSAGLEEKWTIQTTPGIPFPARLTPHERAELDGFIIQAAESRVVNSPVVLPELSDRLEAYFQTASAVTKVTALTDQEKSFLDHAQDLALAHATNDFEQQGILFGILDAIRHSVLVPSSAGLEEKVLRGGHQGPVIGVAYNPDPKRNPTIVTAGIDGTLRIWDQDSGGSRFKPIKHPRPLVVTFRSEPRGIFAVNRRFAASWNMTQGGISTNPPAYLKLNPSLKLRSGNFYPGRVALSPNRRTLLVIEDDAPAVQVRNLDEKILDHQDKPKQVLGYFGYAEHGDRFPTSVAYRGDGRIAAMGTDSGSIEIWDLRGLERGKHRRRATLIGHTAPVRSIAFAPGGQQVMASGDASGWIRLWGKGIPKEPFRHVVSEPVNVLAFSPDGAVLATAGPAGTAYFWDVESGALRGIIAGGVEIHALAFSHSGKEITAGLHDGTGRIWEVPAGRTGLEEDKLKAVVGAIGRAQEKIEDALRLIKPNEDEPHYSEFLEVAQKVLTGNARQVREIHDQRVRVFSEFGGIRFDLVQARGISEALRDKPSDFERLQPSLLLLLRQSQGDISGIVGHINPDYFNFTHDELVTFDFLRPILRLARASLTEAIDLLEGLKESTGLEEVDELIAQLQTGEKLSRADAAERLRTSAYFYDYESKAGGWVVPTDFHTEDYGRAVAALIRALEDPDAQVRYHAARSLTPYFFDQNMNPGQKALQPLLTAAAREETPRVKGAMLRAAIFLSRRLQYPGDDLIEPVREALNLDQPDEVRFPVASALVEDSGVYPILPALRDVAIAIRSDEESWSVIRRVWEVYLEKMPRPAGHAGPEEGRVGLEEDWAGGPTITLHPGSTTSSKGIALSGFGDGADQVLAVLEDVKRKRASLNLHALDARGEPVPERVGILRTELLVNVLAEAEHRGDLAKGIRERIWLKNDGRFDFYRPETLAFLRSDPVRNLLAEKKERVLIKKESGERAHHPGLGATLHWRKNSVIFFDTASENPNEWEPFSELFTSSMRPVTKPDGQLVYDRATLSFTGLHRIDYGRRSADEVNRILQGGNPAEESGLEEPGWEAVRQVLMELGRQGEYWSYDPSDPRTQARAILVDASEDLRVANVALALSVMKAKQNVGEVEFRLVVHENAVQKLTEHLQEVSPEAVPSLMSRIVLFGPNTGRNAQEARDYALNKLAKGFGYAGPQALAEAGAVRYVNRENFTQSLALQLAQFFHDGALPFTTETFDRLQTLIEAA